MTLFWAIGALLAAAAAALVLWPLLSGRRAGRAASHPSHNDSNVSIYRDQLRELDADRAAGKLAPDDYAGARAELEARLLADVAAPDAPAPRRPGRGAALVIGAAIPLVAAALYFSVGTPQLIAPPEEQHALNVQQLTGLVERLASHMRENPDDVEGWKLLARSYTALNRFPEAVDAYAKAVARAPRDAQLLADFADVLATTRRSAGAGNLQGEPEKLVLRALEIEPQNLKALALAGTAAFDRKDYSGAVRYWQRMLPLVAAGSEDARSIQASIDEAKSLAGRRPLRGTVSLSAKVRAQAAPDDTVFIFARAEQGPPMPLAVQRAKVRDLPVAFALDDSMAMAPGLRLSGFPRVIVSARVSKSGGATPQPGDLLGASAPVANDAQGVKVAIDSVVQ